MPSLHIEHAITDLDTWQNAFEPLHEVRRQAGVIAEVVRQPVNDPNRVALDFEFDTLEHASDFLDFLQTHIWAVPENSPALVGTPTATVLNTIAHSAEAADQGEPGWARRPTTTTTTADCLPGTAANFPNRSASSPSGNPRPPRTSSLSSFPTPIAPASHPLPKAPLPSPAPPSTTASTAAEDRRSWALQPAARLLGHRPTVPRSNLYDPRPSESSTTCEDLRDGQAAINEPSIDTASDAAHKHASISTCARAA